MILEIDYIKLKNRKVVFCMALIKCSECGKEFSDKASACPNCACPIDEAKKENTKENRKQKVKNYSELTNIEKSSIRLYMKSKGESSNSAIILISLGFVFIIIGLFVGFWLLFTILGFGLTIAGSLIQTESEKKFYYKNPSSVNNKKNEVEYNKAIAKKYLPILIIGPICIVLGVSLTQFDSELLGIILIFIGVICYITYICLCKTNQKK